MEGTELIQALNKLCQGYGDKYAEAYQVAGFPDPLALQTLNESDVPSVPLGIRRLVIRELGEVIMCLHPPAIVR